MTYGVPVALAVALPAHLGTEVITRGLIALRDTRTPLATNTGQVLARVVIIAGLVDRVGVLAIPIALAVAATLETLALSTILWFKLRRRIQSAPRLAPRPG